MGLCNCSKNKTQPTGFGRASTGQQAAQRAGAAQPTRPASPPPQGSVG